MYENSNFTLAKYIIGKAQLLTIASGDVNQPVDTSQGLQLNGYFETQGSELALLLLFGRRWYGYYLSAKNSSG